MGEHSHKSLQVVFICITILFVSYLYFHQPKEQGKVTEVKRNDSANFIIINPPASQTIYPSQQPYIPFDRDSLIALLKEIYREKETINKYDSTLYVKHDSDTTGVIPYSITTKGTLLNFSIHPHIISTERTITRQLDFGIYGGLGVMSMDNKYTPVYSIMYEDKKGYHYGFSHSVSGSGWSAKVEVPIFRKYK